MHFQYPTSIFRKMLRLYQHMLHESMNNSVKHDFAICFSGLNGKKWPLVLTCKRLLFFCKRIIRCHNVLMSLTNNVPEWKLIQKLFQKLFNFPSNLNNSYHRSIKIKLDFYTLSRYKHALQDNCLQANLHYTVTITNSVLF